ncbi:MULTISPECIES: cation diffusion facilitator family transporter [Pseudoalteromonas]|uniref:Cation-efflux pump FieF n=1 Tax=Pseudoalteromonas luteoviolacea (strain 2ta16) TaxID=1353533 RepID=V4H815_PSEL2|nr:cation diffusion facilitator family transporter [Pseudoalteromonas luteoviolacea]ESP93631.1 cation diffusion facilitator family transporter [Pseudoalteromonas luteoviolacea 2ta16]KZN42420.1 iron transporter [Pseudoalteromonas luteoviolacea NCIMB 1944]
MAQNYDALVRFSSIFTIVMAGVMIAAKAWAWLSSGSAAMLGSLTDSMLDVTASLMSFFVLSYALRPADDDHRFGHGKAEALAGLGQAAFISGSACLLAFHGVERLFNPVEINQSLLGVWVSVFAIVCTLLVVVVQHQVVKRTQSLAIKADSMHYKGDILLNIAVLIAMMLSHYHIGWADPVFAIGVAIYLLFNCWGIARESADHLMDKELPESEKADIIAIANSHAAVYGVHNLRTRQSGKVKFVQLHLELDDDMPLMEAHQIADEIVARIQASSVGEIDVLVHQDPVSLSVTDSANS